MNISKRSFTTGIAHRSARPVCGASFLWVCAIAFAQVGGPSLGLVPDAGSLRAMNGIASAGTVGELMRVGTGLSLVEVSPTQQFALAVAQGNGNVFTLNRTGGSAGVKNQSGIQLSPVAGANASPDLVVFSPNGTAAALWFSSTMQVQVIAGLPSAPSVTAIDASFMGSGLAALAVSDDGQWVAGGWSAGARVFGPNSSVLPLAADGPVLALSFFHGKSDVALITSDQLLTVSDVGGAAVSSLIWSKPASDSATAAPIVTGIALSSDNSRLTVVGSTGGIDTFELSSGATQYVNCGCAPTALASLGGSLYRLTGVASGTVQLYDASTGDIWFVPLSVRPSVRRATRADAAAKGEAQP